MRRKLLPFVSATAAAMTSLAGLSVPSAVQADTLLIERIEAAQPAAAERPTRGMSQAQVTARWGAPASKTDAVGQPPISRWEYPDFVVFFEYDHVLHAVTPRS